MKYQKWMRRLLIGSIALCAGRLPAVNMSVENLSTETLKPKGTYYDVTVPATLDLAETAKLSVHGLTTFLNPNQNYGPYGQAWFNVRVPYLTSRLIESGDSGLPNWGKIAEALEMTRNMSGSTENLDIERKSLNGMIAWAPEDGWTPTARIMLALMALHERDPDPKIPEIIERLAESFQTRAKIVPEGAVYYEAPSEDNDGPAGIYRSGTNVWIQGNAIRVLTRWYEISGDKKSLELAGKLVMKVFSVSTN